MHKKIATKSSHLLIILIYINLIYSYIFFSKILTDSVYYNSFSHKFSTEDINRLLSFKKEYGWISYIAQILTLVIKIYFTALCIYIGILLNENKIKFIKILKIALYAEFVFIFYSGIRMIMIYYIDFITVEQIQKFWPLSLFSLFPGDSIPQWLFYPLYTINIAEIAYWLVLALGLTYLMKTKFLQSLKTVLTSYGAGLLLWMVFLVFVQLYFLESV